MGRANTLRGFQATRPVWDDQEEELKQMQVPTLLVVGDEDEPCINPGIYLKKLLPRCGLAIIPQAGHTVQVEEASKFNRVLEEFLAEVEAIPLTDCAADAFSASMTGTQLGGPPARRPRNGDDGIAPANADGPQADTSGQR